jgi:hypothetical protein
MYFMRAEDGAAAQDDVRRNDWKTDAALLQTLFESAKQAGAVKDTSNEGPSEWMSVSTAALMPPSPRSIAVEFDLRCTSVVSDAATADADVLRDLASLADTSARLAKEILPVASDAESPALLLTSA